MEAKLLPMVLLVLPMWSHAEPLFGKSLAGDAKLPKTFGVGIDYFGMDQPYRIDSLVLAAPPGIPLPPIADTGSIKVHNEFDEVDLKLDVWLLPFLNAFGLYGRIDGETVVDLSNIGASLPPEIRRLQIDYDGDVYGAGLVAVVGGDRWFASVTGTYTDTNLKGDYESSVETVVLQPRVGVRLRGTTEIWIGGYWLDAEESHSGSIDLNFGFGPVPVEFAADLSQDEDFNFAFGMHTMFSDSWEATLEVGGGDRDTLLANLTYRFE